jgi:hypothetical protein
MHGAVHAARHRCLLGQDGVQSLDLLAARRRLGILVVVVVV